MPLPRPRSLSSLLVVGLLVLVVPLVVALVQATVQLGRLAQDTDQLVREGVQLASLTQVMFRHVASYERSVNLYLLLGDPRVLEASRSTQQQVSEAADRLASLRLDDEGFALVGDLRSAATGTLALLEFGRQVEPNLEERVAARLVDVSAAASALARNANDSLDARLQALERRADETRRNLLLWLVALLPAALALAVLFALGVLRPLNRVDRAITELGRGTFSQPVVIRGPSDIETLGRQLEWLRIRLLNLAQEKNRFLRHMSHELKTPLANIREGTDLLLDGTVGEIGAEQREVTGIMRENAMRLQQVIENLLSYSAWQSQVGGLELSEFPLETELAASFRAQRPTLVSRRIRTKAEVEHTMVVADRGKIRLVLDNLLSNALKFTPEEGTITVRARRSDVEIVIDFADTGPGVSAKERERIFEAFYTGNALQAGHFRGTGIGLSIVAEFVAAHGGRVELMQGEFSGAHFRIHLPIESSVRIGARSKVHA